MQKRLDKAAESIINIDSKKALLATLNEKLFKVDCLLDTYAKSVGLTYSAILILWFLQSSTEVYTQKDICERLGLPKQLVYSVIKPFWEQGFVELREAKDRRNKNVIMTNKGKEYALSVLKPLEDAEITAWSKFSDDEFIAFVKTMQEYVDAFGEVLKGLKIE